MKNPDSPPLFEETKRGCDRQDDGGRGGGQGSKPGENGVFC
ncbi:MAG: hypothetical protein U1E22_05920 [Coriobacteriia bacterium]|nr:hypothetical protein [Coriobacteriia bacterium]